MLMKCLLAPIDPTKRSFDPKIFVSVFHLVLQFSSTFRYNNEYRRMSTYNIMPWSCANTILMVVVDGSGGGGVKRRLKRTQLTRAPNVPWIMNAMQTNVFLIHYTDSISVPLPPLSPSTTLSVVVIYSLPRDGTRTCMQVARSCTEPNR